MRKSWLCVRVITCDQSINRVINRYCVALCTYGPSLSGFREKLSAIGRWPNRAATQGRPLNGDEDLLPWRNCTDPCHDHVQVGLNDRPALVSENHKCNLTPGQILLVRDVLVTSHQNVEAVALGRGDEHTVGQFSPSDFRAWYCRVTDQKTSKDRRNILV
jgi:hypothetical protein